MLGRVARRLNATFRGPTARDALDAGVRLDRELQQLRAELADLKAVAEPFHLRPGTHDGGIYRDVLVNNEYCLPERFGPEDVVIDIGAHVGGFSAACLLRGAGRVVAFEPLAANHALLSVNLARFGGRAEARRSAVWRSDRPAGALRYQASDDPSNTGGGGLLFATGDAAVPAVPLDAVVAELLAGAGVETIRLLKLDCEGSEYPILLTATCLDRVAEVCGEYHDVGAVPPESQVGDHTAYDHRVLVEHLSRAGFEVRTEIHPKDPRLGLFWARRAAR